MFPATRIEMEKHFNYYGQRIGNWNMLMFMMMLTVMATMTMMMQ